MEDPAAGSARAGKVSNKNTHQVGLSLLRQNKSLAYGIAISTYGCRQNLQLKIPNNIIDGAIQYAETDRDFFRQKLAISGELQYNLNKLTIGLRLGIYATFRQNNVENDGYLNKSNFNSELGRKQIEVEEKWHAGESNFSGSISRLSIQYAIIEQLRIGTSITYNDFIKSQEKLYYTVKIREDTDWTNSTSPPPVVNNLRLYEPLWVLGFNITYIPKF